jgi:hypothetical protein
MTGVLGISKEGLRQVKRVKMPVDRPMLRAPGRSTCLCPHILFYRIGTGHEKNRSGRVPNAREASSGDDRVEAGIIGNNVMTCL